MGRPLIDRLGDPVRRHLMTSLFYAPSLGALALAGGWVPVAAATGMFTALAAYAYLRIKIEIDDVQKLQDSQPRHIATEHRRSAPLKVQRMCKRLCRDLGIEKPVRVYLYPAAYPAAFATADNEIGFSRKFYAMLNRGELEWVIAHELSHIAKGDTKVNYAMLQVSNYMERVAAAIGGGAAMQAMGHTGFDALGAGALTALFAVTSARRYVDGYSSRSMERRRDYEATQKTAKPFDAISAIAKVEMLQESHKMTLSERWRHVHPIGMARVNNIITAYYDGLRRGIIAWPAPEPAA